MYDKVRYDFSVSYYKSSVEITIHNDTTTPFNRFIYSPVRNEIYYINDHLKEALKDTIVPDTSKIFLFKKKYKSRFLNNAYQCWRFNTNIIENGWIYKRDVNYLISSHLKTPINYISLELPFFFPSHSSGVVLKYCLVDSTILNSNLSGRRGSSIKSNFEAIKVHPISLYSTRELELPKQYKISPFTKTNKFLIQEKLWNLYGMD